MKRPRVTINAAMLAAAIRIDAGIEADVRAVVGGDDRARLVSKKLRGGAGAFFHRVISVFFVVQRFEAIGGINPRAAPANDGKFHAETPRHTEHMSIYRGIAALQGDMRPSR